MTAYEEPKRMVTSNNPVLDRTASNLLLFILIAFGFSWAIWIPAGLFLNEAVLLPFTLLGGFGPFIAAIIVIRLREGKESLRAWLRQTFRLRIHILWYLAGGLLIPFMIAAIHHGIYVMLGGQSGFSFNQPWYMYLGSLIPTMLVGGGNEEPGWRGFAIPRLMKKFPPIIANIMLGIVWMLWHLPLYLVGSWSGTGQPIGWFILYAGGLSIILTWLYYRSRKSILPAMLLHAGTNVVFQFFPMQKILFKSLDYDFTVIKTLVYWLFALLIIVFTRGKLGYKAAEDSTNEIHP